MFSQIEKDMNELLDNELSRTSAVLCFGLVCFLAYLLTGWLGLGAIVAAELIRYGREC